MQKRKIPQETLWFRSECFSNRKSLVLLWNIRIRAKEGLSPHFEGNAEKLLWLWAVCCCWGGGRKAVVATLAVFTSVKDDDSSLRSRVKKCLNLIANTAAHIRLFPVEIQSRNPFPQTPDCGSVFPTLESSTTCALLRHQQGAKSLAPRLLQLLPLLMQSSPAAFASTSLSSRS